MKVGDVLPKTFDVISKKPSILALYVLPAMLALVTAGLQFAYHVPMQERLQREILQNPERALEIVSSVFLTSSIFLAMCCMGLLGWFLSMIAAAVAISMTADTVGGKITSIGEAFGKISGRLPVFMVVSLIAVIIYSILGVLTCCMGFIALLPFIVFIQPAIIIDNLGFDSIGKSINMGKENYVHALLIGVLFALMGIVFNMLPFIGGAISQIVMGVCIVAFGVFYIGASAEKMSSQVPNVTQS